MITLITPKLERNQEKIDIFHNINLKKRKQYKKSSKTNKKKKKKKIVRVKEDSPDRNFINLSSINLISSQKTDLVKDSPSYVPRPCNINWYDLSKYFDQL